jgi:hypothetical protein
VTDPLVDQLWQRFRGTARERVAVLEQRCAALVAGTASVEQEQEAVAAAHKLAGALGTYGRPGSDVARDVELLLTRGGDRSALPGLVEQLRRAVTDPGPQG